MSAPAQPEAEMFPLVENAHYTEAFDTFAELRENAEGTSEGLNQIQSWFIYDELDEDWGKWNDLNEGEPREFSLCICMPRKSQFTVWTTHTFERGEVEAWLESYVKPRVLRWYGWTCR